MALPAIEFLSEKTITGSYYGSADVHAAISRADADWSSKAGSISARSCPYLIGLDDVEAALERLRRGQGARSVIVIDEQLAGVRTMSHDDLDGRVAEGWGGGAGRQRQPRQRRARPRAGRRLPRRSSGR